MKKKLVILLFLFLLCCLNPNKSYSQTMGPLFPSSPSCSSYAGGGPRLGGTTVKNPNIQYFSGDIVYEDTEGTQFTGMGTITISSGDSIITILDRNLGAINNDVLDSGSVGYFFQRGNNYGFLDEYSTSNTLVDVSGDMLWGGTGDSSNPSYPLSIENAVNRQGPCPEGFHVPSKGELNQLTNLLGNSGSFVIDSLYLPKKAIRSSSTGERWFNDSNGQGGYSAASLLTLNVLCSDGFGWSVEAGMFDRAQVRCFYNYYDVYTKQAPILVFTTNDSTTTTVGGNQPVTGLPTTMTVTQNTISTAEGKEVLGEVNLDFGSNQTAIFSHPVQVKIPVSDYEQVYVKVKHGGESTYGFNGLTINSSASCSNGEPTSSQYNGETINVVDGYATIYSCAASSFIALGVENGGDSKVIVNIAEFNEGRNTCTGDNYVFNNIVAGPTTVTGNLVKTFQCAFGEAGGKAVTIQLSGDLEDGNGNTISSGNVKIKNSVWTATPSNVQSGTTAITTYTPLNQIVTLFNKAAGVIGRAEGSGVDIEITVLGGTPDGTYNGTLVLTY